MRRRAAELWLIDLDAAASALQRIERAVPRLSEDDRRRAERLVQPQERQRRLAAYIALRIALEREAGAGVRGVAFARSPGGRPGLPSAGPSFSLAHTGQHALVGLAHAATIGVDLEHARPIRMSPSRREAIVAAGAGLGPALLGQTGTANALGGDTDTELLCAWCRLEACAKADGRGLARLLVALGIRSAANQSPASPRKAPKDIELNARRFAAAAGLAVYDLALPASLHGAAALSRDTAKPRLQRFPEDRGAIERWLATPA